jgi:4,5-dihydroxyphthalate decarboxylase
VLRANALDRSSRITGSGADWGKIKPLFPDRMAEAERFQKQHGFLPVNHTYIIRGDIYQKHPWVAFNLYNGFVRAKALAREKLLESIPSALFFGPEYLKRTQDIIGEDPFPYGIKANEAMLETITAYSYEQGLTPNKMNFKELFAENTLDF